MTAEEELELIEIEQELRRRKGGEGAPAPKGGTPAASAKMAFRALMDTPVAGTLPSPSRMIGVGADVGAEGGGAALGQAAGAATGPFAPVAVPVLGAIGGAGGNALAQYRRMQSGEQEKFSYGQLAGAGVSGAIPGASLAGAGGRKLAVEAAKQGGANLAAGAVQTAVDEKRAPSLGEAALYAGTGAVAPVIGKRFDKGAKVAEAAAEKSRDSVRRETLRLGREHGLIVPPAVTNPGAFNETMTSLAGKMNVAQDAIVKNQPRINAIARADINLPPDMPLDKKAFDTASLGPNSIYETVASVSPESKELLEQFRRESDRATALMDQWIEGERANPELLSQAKEMRGFAKTTLKQLRAEIQDAPYVNNRDKLMDNFDEARKRLAKISHYRRAANKGDGNIDASAIGKAYEFGDELTDGLEVIGRFQNAFDKYVKELSQASPPGGNKLTFMTGSVLGGGGFAGGMMAGNPALALGSAAGGIAFPFVTEYAARKAIPSNFYQKAFASPDYGPQRADLASLFAQYSARAAGRNPYFVNQPAAQ